MEFVIGSRVEEYLSNFTFGYSSDALHIIVNNLLSNALKFTSAGGHVRMNVDCRAGILSIEVKDTGIGIAEEHIEHVFDRFYQIEEPGRPTYSGSGIGLALSKELALLHGGDIQVLSVKGQGSTFLVTLKDHSPSESIVLDNSKAIDPALNVEVTEVNIEESELPLILVVEDQHDLRQFIKNNLSEFGTVLEAENGKQGVAIAVERVPDIIVSDLMMPELDGLELCRSLKSRTETSHIPIILLTARADEEARLQGLQDGADDYIAKPFSVKELQLRVRNRLRVQKQFADLFVSPSHEVEVVAQEEPVFTAKELDWLNQLKNTILANLDNAQFGVNHLAESNHISTSQMNRKLKALTGHSSLDLIRQIKMEKALELLRKMDSVSDVAYAVGYDDPLYFSKVFKKFYGFPPSKSAHTS